LQSGKAREWWKAFGDTRLDTLVNTVIENNLDIEKATAAVMELQARNTQARAGRLPSVTLKGDYSKNYSPEQPANPFYPTERKSENYNLSIAASHEMDLWGKISRSHEAARADLLMSIENRRTVIQSVIATTVTLYLQIESLERRIDIAGRSVESYRKSVSIVEKRYQSGLTSILDLKQARRARARAQSNLPQLSQDLGKAQHNLSVLLGRYPRSTAARLQPGDYFKELPPVPAGIPSRILETRPDIRAAEAKLKALNARYGMAVANLFPRITLTGSRGYSNDELNDLFTPQNLLWNLAKGITQPIFYSGKLLAEKSAAHARYRQGLADYAKTVLTAFSEVESALLTRGTQMEKRSAMIEYFKEALETLRIAESRYQRGLSSYLSVLDALQARYSAEESLVLVDLSIMTNRVSLYRALGGKWLDETKKEGK
jgi:multidrug efflux system outer membrane protein